MNYIAKKDGFIGGVLIRAGQPFTHEGKPGKWMEPAKDQAPVKEAEKPVKAKRKPSAEPQTFSEMAHLDGADGLGT